MHCTQCGAEGRGKFCGACGASLRSLTCSGCGEEIAPGFRFCTGCGTSVSGRPSEASLGAASEREEGRGGGLADTAGWWIAGGLGGVLIAVLGFAFFDDGQSADSAQPPAGEGPAPDVDLSSMTPREAADRLFNRVIMGVEAGDSAEVSGFLPMAIDAYEMARPLDEDGQYHLAVLRLTAGDYEEALAASLEGLETNPDHLLNLSSAAEASIELGEDAAAADYYARLLDAWEEEMAEERVEYLEHAPIMPMIRDDAREFLEEDQT